MKAVQRMQAEMLRIMQNKEIRDVLQSLNLGR